ncbi:MAG: serine/threonine-protein phosphatase [Leptospiraceae bacterium]|nr:serine/threonine-protein phosphatase [Leptospiraceae bacterium]
MLAVSLSDKANVVKRESQEATIRTLKYQETAKHDLEKKVQERTEELNKYVNTLKKDLQMANSIQLNIIPKEFLFLNSFNVYSKYIPLDKVGGDFYDIFEFNQNKIRLFIADATGHGVQAALVTMSIKSEYDSLKSIILQPSELLEELNLRFKDIYKNIKVYFSAVVLDLDLLNNKLTYSSAGHPDQFLIREKEIIPLRRTNRIMGLSIASDFVDKEIDFYKEDKIILFTDGIFEQFNDSREQYGDVRLKEKVLANLNSSVQTIVSEILQDLEEFVGEKEKQDDITIIGVECT